MFHFREAAEGWTKHGFCSQNTCVQGLVLLFKSYMCVGNLLNHSEPISSSVKWEQPYCLPAFTGLLIHHMGSAIKYLSPYCGLRRGSGKGSWRRWQLRTGVNEVKEWALWMSSGGGDSWGRVCVKALGLCVAACDREQWGGQELETGKRSLVPKCLGPWTHSTEFGFYA